MGKAYKKETTYEMLAQFLIYAKTLQPNWNTYDAETPNEFSLTWTIEIIDLLVKNNLFPLHIAASAENGVGIILLNNKRFYCDIEIFNGGEIAAIFVVKNPDGKEDSVIQAWDIESNLTSLQETIDRIQILVKQHD